MRDSLVPQDLRDAAGVPKEPLKAGPTPRNRRERRNLGRTLPRAERKAGVKVGKPLSGYTVELGVWVCLGCYEVGQELRLPIHPAGLLNPKLGIDVFLNEAPVKSRHECNGKDPKTRNQWKETVLRIPEEFVERWERDPAIRWGAPEIHPDWKTASEESDTSV
jgi:hypothetical protein